MELRVFLVLFIVLLITTVECRRRRRRRHHHSHDDDRRRGHYDEDDNDQDNDDDDDGDKRSASSSVLQSGGNIIGTAWGTIVPDETNKAAIYGASQQYNPQGAFGGNNYYSNPGYAYNTGGYGGQRSSRLKHRRRHRKHKRRQDDDDDDDDGDKRSVSSQVLQSGGNMIGTAWGTVVPDEANKAAIYGASQQYNPQGAYGGYNHYSNPGYGAQRSTRRKHRRRDRKHTRRQDDDDEDDDDNKALGRGAPDSLMAAAGSIIGAAWGAVTPDATNKAAIFAAKQQYNPHGQYDGAVAPTGAASYADYYDDYGPPYPYPYPPPPIRRRRPVYYY